jgi:hypothetical protein
VGNTPELYTTDLATLARAFDGEENVMIMVINRELIVEIKASVAEGRRYRATKIEIEEAARKLQRDNRETCQKRFHTRRFLQSMQSQLGTPRNAPHNPVKITLEALTKECRDAERAVDAHNQDRQQLMRRLREAEKQWISTMRKLAFSHECVLADAGVMNDVPLKRYAEEFYDYDTFLRSRDDQE